MKKIIACFMLFCIAFGLTFVLAGCAKKCKHNWVLTSDTSTCEEDGVKTYECDLCHVGREEFSSATKHDWEEIDSTATCISGGVATYRCKKCNKTKQESLQAIGHSYDKYGICEACGQFEYHITCSINSPLGYGFQYNWGINYWSKIEISETSFKVMDGYLYAVCSGTKTYDKNGEYGSTEVRFKVVLYDSNDNIIASNDAWIYNMIVGQQFVSTTEICATVRLSPNERYILKVVSNIN